jgi:hypothetical protein
MRTSGRLASRGTSEAIVRLFFCFTSFLFWSVNKQKKQKKHHKSHLNALALALALASLSVARMT